MFLKWYAMWYSKQLGLGRHAVHLHGDDPSVCSVYTPGTAERGGWLGFSPTNSIFVISFLSVQLKHYNRSKLL